MYIIKTIKEIKFKVTKILKHNIELMKDPPESKLN